MVGLRAMHEREYSGAIPPPACRMLVTHRRHVRCTRGNIQRHPEISRLSLARVRVAAVAASLAEG